VNFMKVVIGKLGIIENTEIDLKPLAIFVGPNNSGKTWLAYALSGILGGFGWNEYAKAKELSPLVLYLRYLAQPGALVIVDEPEMNLHPAAQVKITEFLTMLVNAGLRILVTTHSTYLVDHMTNPMEAAKYERADQIAIAEKFFLQRSDAFIPQQDVSVYLFENGGAKSILDKDGKIGWTTFSKVTDEIETISYEL
jgi:predicted ATPase